MTISIRAIDAWQAAAIMPVMQAAFDPAHGEAWSLAQLRDALVIPGTALIVADADDRPVGFALARTIVDATELMLLAVDPVVQRRGVGRALVAWLIAGLASREPASIFVEVRADNPARHFYSGLGFVDIGRRNNYYRGRSGEYSDAVTMALQVENSHLSNTCAR